MRMFLAAILLFGASSALAAPAADAWSLRLDGTRRCVFRAYAQDGKTLVDAIVPEPDCNLTLAAFGEDEALLFFRSNGAFALRAWRVTAKGATRLSPPVDELQDGGYVDGALVLTGLVHGEAYSSMRSKVAWLIPGDPGCRVPLARAVALDGAKWTERERTEGTCTDSPPALATAGRFYDDSRKPVSEVDSMGMLRSPADLAVRAALHKRIPADWWVFGEPPRLAAGMDGGKTTIVVLDAGEPTPTFALEGWDPLVSQRRTTRIVLASGDGSLLVLGARAKVLVRESDVVHAGFWGVRLQNPYDHDEGW